MKNTIQKPTEEELLAYYKAKLKQSMEAFAVPLSDRITLSQAFELKFKDVTDVRQINDTASALQRLLTYFGADPVLASIAYDDWLACAKHLLTLDVYRGAKTAKGQRKMSPGSLRKIYAYASAAISHIQDNGIAIDNHPIQVMKTFIRPLLNEK